MTMKVKIYLEQNDEKFMGIGVLWLLENLEKTRSLRSAAALMGISYSKAFRMIDELETALGCKVLERRKGGKDRGGAFLTSFGKGFIELYDVFQKKCKKLMDEPFEEFENALKELMAEDKN
ncbi:MAG: LysR family transcriptional regulator [Sphaerochaetaceae bacterium]|nr:LysR family transcriptional regulator [Sphaerochaetaceae bacterium]